MSRTTSSLQNSAKQLIFNAIIMTLGKGDQAVLPAPYFVSYPET
jgi:aspartate aminotransferase